MIISDAAFEIGAIFLLCAMLMYGTLSGFIPRAFHVGRPAPLFAMAALVLIAAYYFAPGIASAWRSSALPEFPAPRISTTHPSSAATAPRPAVSPQPRKPARIESVAPVSIDESLPVKQEPIPHIKAKIDPEPAVEQQPESQDSPYDSGIKRTAKHVGRFLFRKQQ